MQSGPPGPNPLFVVISGEGARSSRDDDRAENRDYDRADETAAPKTANSMCHFENLPFGITKGVFVACHVVSFSRRVIASPMHCS